MKIAFLTPEYPHANCTQSAGLGSSIRNLSKALVANGISVVIFVYGQQHDQIVKDEGITLHLIKQLKYPFLNWYFNRKHIQNILNKYIIQDQIDLVETQDWTGIAAYLKLKCPLIVRLHGSDAYFCSLEKRTQKLTNYWLEKKGLLNADHIISVSEFTAQKTKEIFALKKSITVLHNGIDVNQFQPVETAIEKNTILYFGTIIRKKGVLELAKAFNKVIESRPNSKLILLGKDTKDVFTGKSTISMFIDELSEKAKKAIEFVNEVPYDEVKNYLGSAHVITLPSFAEAFPMTWLEAMAMQKALVTSNIGWANEMMVEGKTGYTINPKNTEDFAAKIIRILEDDTLRDNFGIESRKRVSKLFASKKIVMDNIKLFKKLTNEF
jgi:glycosyltransferase involved in cell wall biosynthesis